MQKLVIPFCVFVSPLISVVAVVEDTAVTAKVKINGKNQERIAFAKR